MYVGETMQADAKAKAIAGKQYWMNCTLHNTYDNKIRDVFSCSFAISKATESNHMIGSDLE